MKFHIIEKNTEFIAREREIRRLDKIFASGKQAQILVFYGRRRVGKTELIEQFFREKKVLKFEGLQPGTRASLSQKEEFKRQSANCLRMLARYKEEALLSKISLDSWAEFFELIDPILKNEEIVLYFEELQWLSNYSSDFLAELKIFWDNHWRRYRGLTIVFCGSSPAFIVGEFIADKALYGRSINLFHIKPFNLHETSQYLNCGFLEALHAQLTVGGVSEYLNQLKKYSSLHEGLLQESFVEDGFFVEEIERIFISNIRAHSAYRGIVEKLSEKSPLDRGKLAKTLGESPGGTFTKILQDLEICGFIDKYTPLHLEANSKLVRYAACDPYAKFFFRFIKPKLRAIRSGQYNENPQMALNQIKYQTALGLNFENWCRTNYLFFAKYLGFEKIEFRSGSFFNKQTDIISPGFQIDLMFIRADSRIIISEIKYGSSLVDTSVVNSLYKKIELFKKAIPKYRNYTIETLLITPEESEQSRALEDKLDHVVAIENLISSS